ncbi:long tail fiber protein distal subunit [Enterobacter phage PG7]|uniref:Long tail fiber protein Gp37 n=1 Tax=Enterobacter phage PG7 TaxID=1455074 RepID=W6ATP7_9CAUD|nr:long tail fiber protein distal subunit [Enterobacter phage PG7]AHI61175.1 long tail fiber distal subunit [Enterobacter phage PG7]
MATIKQIQFKRSNVAGKRPLPADIAEGELAINIKDSTLFTKNADGQIIDLGFAKGGKIDGNVTQVGNYTQTGSTTISNELTVGMDITAKRNVNVSGQVVADSDIRAMNGSIRTRAREGSNSHIWFEGDEMTRINYERAVMYASPQTASADGGGVRLRVQNGTQEGAGQALFVWNGSGDFVAPKDVYAQRSRLSIESIAPVMNTNRLLTANKPFGAQQYSWEDTVTYTKATGALNYVYKGRANIEGTIWHNIIDERTGAENAWYTGSGPANKMYSLWSRSGKGHGFYSGSLMVGANNLGEYSGLGDSSIAIGDNDTGFRWDGDGKFSVMANARRIAGIDSTTTHQFNIRKCTIITHTDNNDAKRVTAYYNAILQIDTSKDGNNSGGNGLTLLGYNANGAYHHYFRGNGAANFNMAVNIDNNQLQMTGAGPAEKIVINYAENGSGYLRGRRAGAAQLVVRMRIKRLICAAFYNNLTGASVSLTTKIALNKPTDVQSVLTILDNGSLIFTKSGANPRNTRIFHAGDATRGNRIEFADDSSYLMYIERHPSIGIQLVTNGGHIKTNSGSVYTEAIALNSGARFVADGNIYLPNATNGFSTGWLLGQINSRINGVNDNANNRVAKSGDTMTGTLTINNGSNTGVMVSGITSGSDKGLIRGNVDGGAHRQWENRSAGIQLDCPSSDGSAYNIWKATKWGAYHIAAMDVYAPSGNAYVRLVLRNGGAHIWNNSSYTSPVQINAPEFYLTSDVSLKKDIRSIEDSRSNLHKVEIKRYAMKDGSNDNAIGVIAQEVQEVYPELVNENKDTGKLSVNYRGLSSVLWKIVQEQDKELEDVKSRLARIEELLSK